MFFKRRKELEQLKKLADWGDAEAQYKLAEKYMKGKGVKRDVIRGKELYEEAANKGYVPAYAAVGELYYNGIMDVYGDGQGFDRDYVKAAKWLEKAAESSDYDEELYVTIGLIYDEGGYGLEPDPAKAIKWLTKPAENGDFGAQNALGYSYYLLGDNEKALYWKTKAAEGGGADERCSLGALYEDLEDYKNAAIWYQKAADENDEFALSYLAQLYFNGKGVPQDKLKAKELWQKSAALGYDGAKQALKENF